ncbi:MAG: hypothetical protein HIU92_04780 [Proteobacteria bacterium]|nr:hypothetical protein [Pseudomonadota bacterium]
MPPIYQTSLFTFRRCPAAPDPARCGHRPTTQSPSHTIFPVDLLTFVALAG